MSRFVTIPKPVPVPPRFSVGGSAPDFTFQDWFDRIVWNHEHWREGKEQSEMYEMLYEKFDGAEPGDVIELSDDQYDKLLPIATVKGEKILPGLSHVMNQLMKSLFFAATKDPRKKAAPSPKPNAASAEG
jgi:hypothetical protein